MSKSIKPSEYCRFFKGEESCPPNTDEDCWFWEQLVSSCIHDISDENDFLGWIWEYMAKWRPDDCETNYENYLKKRKHTI